MPANNGENKSTSSKSSSATTASGSSSASGPSTTQASGTSSSVPSSARSGAGQDFLAFDNTFKNKHTYLKNRLTQLDNVITPLERNQTGVHNDDITSARRHLAVVDNVFNTMDELIMNATCLDQGNIDSHMKITSQYIPQIMDLRARINKLTYLDTNSVQTSSSQAAHMPVPINTSDMHRRVDNTFKPQLLDADATPPIYHKWKQEFAIYIEQNRMENAPIKVKRMLLNNSLTPEMQNNLARLCLVEDDSPINEVIKQLDTYFSDSNNLMTRRYDYFACKQRDNETIKQFIVRFRNLGDFADLDQLSYKDNMACKIVTCVKSDELRKELLRLPKTDFASIYNHALAWEASQVNFSKIEEINQQAAKSTQLMEVNKISTYKQSKKSQFKSSQAHQSSGQDTRGKSQSQNHNSNQQNQKDRQRRPNNPCFNCGQLHPPRACPAFNQSCSYCNIPGHFARVCRKKNALNSNIRPQVSEVDVKDDNDDGGRMPEPETDAFNFDICNIGTIANKTPKIPVNFLYGSRFLGSEFALPDTGASVSILPASFLQPWGLQCSDLPRPLQLKSVDGYSLQCLGTVTLDVQIMGKTLSIAFVVSPGIGSVILSWFALRSFGLIHKDFPFFMIDDNESTTIATAQGNPDPSVSYFLEKFPKVFMQNHKFNTIKGDPMTIHLKENIQYNNIKLTNKPRPVPIPLQKSTKNQLSQMLQQGVIRPIHEPTSFLSPLLVVPKKNGAVRLVIDYTELNKHVYRPAHPFPSVHDVKATIPSNAKFFATLDAVQGYWQIPLDPSSQPLTAFITPWGRFCFNRAPMGLSSSGDEFCRRGDAVFSHIPNIIKVVDDILIYAQSLKELKQTINKVLQAAQDHNVTLSADKFNIGQKVSFVGLTISNEGIHPDTRHLTAIEEFPKPINRTDLRSFMGLVNQFANFTPDIAKYASCLRPLLAKDTLWTWDQSHQQAFDHLKSILTRPPILQYFDAQRDTKLLTDASRLHGLGYILLQRNSENNWGIISCGSRFLNPPETNYAVCELEALAISWAIKKCRVFLLGLPHFDVVTDHKPLQSIFNSSALQQNDNPRLLRLCHSVAMYRFTVSWVPGRLNFIPDALSRSPVGPRPFTHSLKLHHIDHGQMSSSTDPSITRLADAASNDPQYLDLRQAVKTMSKYDIKKLPASTHAHLRQLLSIWDQLSIDPTSGLVIVNSSRILVPKSQRPALLNCIHAAHQGINRTRARMNSLYYWPGLNNDVVQLVQACSLCQTFKESHPTQPITTHDEPQRPFQYTSCDLFEYQGSHFLIYVDRFSGWPSVAHFHASPSSKQIIAALKIFFRDFGIPNHLRHDGAKHLVSVEFSNFLKSFNIIDELSSAYHPRSNGHAEATVKSIKNLVKKCWVQRSIDMDKFSLALLEYRNVPKLPGGLSPAQMIFGRNLRTLAPCLRYKTISHSDILKAKKLNYDMLNKKYSNFNSSLTSLPPLKPNDNVRMQNPLTKIWDQTGVIQKVRDDNQSYIIDSRGRQFLRNRRYLKLI